jgi:serine/threonine-protein kinase RsbW
LNAAADLRLSVPARAENVGVIRQALAGLGEAIGMDPGALADLKTAVTEACMNVVVHAYGDSPGPLEVTAIPNNGDTVTVSVRDRGAGIQPRPATEENPSLRLGLPLIAALSHGFEIAGGQGRGTEVRIHMRLSKNGDAAEELPGAPVPSGTEMRIAAGELVRPVLARVIAVLAAKADFSIDRLSDAVLVGDAVSAHAASDFPDNTLGIAIEEEEGTLTVRLGPLAEGAGERMLGEMEIPGVGGSLEQLVDDIRVERNEPDGSETLLLRISKAS